MSDLPSLDNVEQSMRDSIEAIQQKLKALGGKSDVVDDLRQAFLDLVGHVRTMADRLADLEDRVDQLDEAAEAEDEDEDEDEE